MNSNLVWLDVISDLLLALAYFTVPVTFAWFIRKRRDIGFSWIFAFFAVFIVACGAAHGLEVWNLWHANYWLQALVKAIAAFASVGTAILLVRFAPRALELPSPTQWIHANAALEKEIRDRRDLELDLRVNESNYREQAELLDLTHDAIFVRNLENKIVYWNRAAERLYGWQREEVRGKITYEFLKTIFATPIDEIQKEILEQGSWEGELTHTRRDGSQVIVSSRWALRVDAAGTPNSILESNRDITQRKREEEKFRNLLESAPDAMVIVDPAGTIHLVNARTEKLFGFSRKELLGRQIDFLVPDRFQNEYSAHRNNYSQSPLPGEMGDSLELYCRRNNGTEFPVEISLSPIETGEGTLTSSAIRDVTARRQSEERIKKLNAELEGRVSELAVANKELEAFSYSVSHDLRAPLRHIDGFARILRDEHSSELSNEALRYLDRILHGANLMGHLVDDLLNLARIGRKEVVRRTVNLENLVRATILDLPETENRSIEWRVEPLPEVECDPGLVKLVFTNLLSNAVKFTRGRQPAVIEVGTRDAFGAVAFFVRDNGVGFDTQYADKLFGVFQRLHRQEDFEGTGVGLATVQRIVQRHGGTVWAESEPEHGSTFLFTLGPQPPGSHMNQPLVEECKS